MDNKNGAEMESLIKALRSVGAEEFISYLNSPWRIFWTNFWAGVFRGLGALIGATAVIAAMLWLLSVFVYAPLVGQYAEDIRVKIVEFNEANQYGDEFKKLEEVLLRIEKDLKVGNHSATETKSLDVQTQ